MNFLDSITYGNPTQEQVQDLKREGLVDELYQELVTYTFPVNTSEATKEELNQIVDYINLVKDKEGYLKRYKAYDRNLRRSFSEFIFKDTDNKDEAMGKVESIIQDTKPLLLKLKYHFNRPRPYQLAQYYKLKLFPFESHSADSPSFPSGHAFMGRLITQVIGNNYPQIYALMDKIFMDICYSRVYMGLHYQSDIDVGIFCADKVLQLPIFKEKYNL